METWMREHNQNTKPFAETTIGKTTLQLIHEYDESGTLRERAVYPNGHKEEFAGHRVPLRVEFEEYNYLKESELSGDEIRKGGTCRIFAAGEQVDEFFFRDVSNAILRASDRISRLWDCSCSWWSKTEREKLPGRRLYYRDFPAVVDRLIVEQGCLILKPDGAEKFPPSACDIEESKDLGGMEPSDGGYAKVEYWDPHIWWWRK